MLANLLAAILASNRGREGCKRIDWDIFVGAGCVRGSAASCCVLGDATDGTQRGSVPRGWVDEEEVGVDVCVVLPSGP